MIVGSDKISDHTSGHLGINAPVKLDFDRSHPPL